MLRGWGRHVSGLIITRRVGCPRPRLLTRAAAVREAYPRPQRKGAGRPLRSEQSTRRTPDSRTSRSRRSRTSGAEEGIPCTRGWGQLEEAVSSAWEAPRLQCKPGESRGQEESRERPGLQPRRDKPFPSGVPPSSRVSPISAFLPRQLGSDGGKGGPPCLSPDSWWGGGA